MSSKITMLMESANELITHIDNDVSNIHYYSINGIPRYDVFVSNDGTFINSNGQPIKRLVEESSTLLMMIQNQIEREIDVGRIKQAELF